MEFKTNDDNSNAMRNTRHFHRVRFECFVELDFEGCQHICELYDISINGALVGACTGATPPPGTVCKLIIDLDAEKENQIIMHGRIAHKIENRVGIHCESIDSESMIHLRNLVAYNLGDAELVNRDLDALSQQH